MLPLRNSLGSFLCLLLSLALPHALAWVPQLQRVALTSYTTTERIQQRTSTGSRLFMADLEYNKDRIRNFSIIAHIDHGMCQAIITHPWIGLDAYGLSESIIENTINRELNIDFIIFFSLQENQHWPIDYWK